MNEISFSYGPHIFDDPAGYIKGAEDKSLAHEDIKKTLISAFDRDDSTSLLAKLSEKFEISDDINISLRFLNYGYSHLVYRLILNSKITLVLSINQPQVPPEAMKTEFENLERLYTKDKHFVINPIAYFQSDNHGLFITSHLDSARCIYARNGNWGAFTPFPDYDFEKFSLQERWKTLLNMIALLVYYYDEEKGQGLAQTRLSGDDFVFTGDKMELENMKLIAARKFITLPFDEYLNKLRQEFLLGTRYTQPDEAPDNMKINHKSSQPIPRVVIERGIWKGKRLRKEKGL